MHLGQITKKNLCKQETKYIGCNPNWTEDVHLNCSFSREPDRHGNHSCSHAGGVTEVGRGP